MPRNRSEKQPKAPVDFPGWVVDILKMDAIGNVEEGKSPDDVRHDKVNWGSDKGQRAFDELPNEESADWDHYVGLGRTPIVRNFVADLMVHINAQKSQ